MYTLYWSDQPRFLEQAEPVAGFYLKNIGSIQITKLHGKYYLSAGDLFGSQTVECVDAEAAFRVLSSVASKSPDSPANLPNGCFIVPNHQESACPAPSHSE